MLANVNQAIGRGDIAAVVLTAGPAGRAVGAPEEAFTVQGGSRFAGGVNSDAVALYAALFAASDEGIVPAICNVFVPNAVVYPGVSWPAVPGASTRTDSRRSTKSSAEIGSLIRKKLVLKLPRYGGITGIQGGPVYQHPFFQRKFLNQNGCCSVAQDVCRTVFSLPVHSSLEELGARRVVDGVQAIAGWGGQRAAA